MSWLTMGGIAEDVGGDFQRYVEAYDRYGCRETPDKGLCQNQFHIALAAAEAHYLRQLGFAGVSGREIDEHLAKYGAGGTIGGQPAALAVAAKQQALTATRAATGRAGAAPPAPKPITPSDTQNTEVELDYRIECMRSGGDWIDGRCQFNRTIPEPSGGCPPGYREFPDGSCGWVQARVPAAASSNWSPAWIAAGAVAAVALAAFAYTRR